MRRILDQDCPAAGQSGLRLAVEDDETLRRIVVPHVHAEFQRGQGLALGDGQVGQL